MAEVIVQLTGDKKLARKLRALSAGGRRCATNVVNETGLRVVSQAKRAVPVDTGRLRSSIRVLQFGKILGVGGAVSTSASDEFTAIVGTDVQYASFIEFGTKFARAQPYLLPAIEANRKFYFNRLKQCIKAEVKKV